MPMDAELETMVRRLHDRQVIRDVVERYCRAIDRQDKALLISCYHADAIDDHGLFVGPADEFFDWTEPSHLHLFQTSQHYVANHSCEISGDVAHCETYFYFAGMPKTGGEIAHSGGRYLDRMERRDGEWRIARRVCLVEWANAAMAVDDAPEEFVQGGIISRDRNDTSYDRPLEVGRARVGLRMGA
jgi:ketosteroid isomerase-like protein